MSNPRPANLETDLWKESLLANFIHDLELKNNPKIALPRLFMRTAAYFGSKAALMEKKSGRYQSVSYKDLAEQITFFAAALLKRNFISQERVALLLKNSPVWVISDLGTMMAGGMVVPIYENLIPAAIHHILNDSETHILIVENKSQFQKIEQIWPQLPHLKHVIIRNKEGVRLKENVTAFDDFIREGGRYLASNPESVSQRVSLLGRDDSASIVYTSGTTGNPKGVVLTHGNFIADILGVISVADNNSLDTFLSILPLSHAFERTVGYYGPLLVGGTIAYAEGLETISQNLLEVRPTICCAVPRVFEMFYARITSNMKSAGFFQRFILAAALFTGGRAWKSYERWQDRRNALRITHHLKNRPSSGKIPRESKFLKIAKSIFENLVYKKIRQKMGGRLRYFVSGGAPLSPALITFFRNLGITIYEGYGMTETSPVISFNFRDTFNPGTVGRVLPNIQVKLSEDGEILVKGPTLMKGYHNNAQATAEMIDSEGWLHTGDVGMFDENHFLKITDRIKELLVLNNGKKVAPLPIENKLTESSWLSNAMVIGNNQKAVSVLVFPNFEQLNLFAKTKSLAGLSKEDLCKNPQVREVFSELIEDVNQNLSSYEQIKKFEIIPANLSIETGELTPTLKIKRRVIEQKFAEYIEKIYGK
jgi:long-chain acyl-CoA synthetase